MVGFASAAATQDETRFLAAAMNMLARHHESVAPIVEVSAPHPVVGRTAAGVLLLPLPVDYVAWTQNVARHAEAPGLKGARPIGVGLRQVSPRARKELTTTGGRSTRSSRSRPSASRQNGGPAWPRRSIFSPYYFTLPAVRPPTRWRSISAKSTTTGTMAMTEAANSGFQCCT